MEENPWYENDEFWEKLAPFMFPPERWEGTPEEVDLLEALLEIKPGAAILDLGCGPGRHSIELARRGHYVTGVDRTPFFLARAQETAEHEGAAIEFVQEDMRQFRRAGAYDRVLSMFTTFGYFEEHAENCQVLANVYESLKPGGQLVIEVMGKEVLARIFQEKDWVQQDEAFLLQERQITGDWRWMNNRWILIEQHGRFEQQLGHWLYSAAELSDMLGDAGFKEKIAYGDLTGAPYDQNASRLVVIAKKASS